MSGRGSTSVPGYMGVTVWNPAGKCIGRIRLPETCANLCFCGPKRDWLWMCASQSVYLVRTGNPGGGSGLKLGPDSASGAYLGLQIYPFMGEARPAKPANRSSGSI